MGDEYDDLDDDDDYDELEGENDFDSDEDSDAELEDITNLELEFPLEDAQKAGKQEYLNACSDLAIVPIALFIAKMEVEHINLNHHGMGVKGALAIAECLKVNDKIMSINLGDNWLGDRGCQALAEVLGVNTTLTSLSLSSNRVGLPGAQALATKLPTNTTLAELNLRGNRLDDRSAIQLATAVSANNALTRLDLSYNHFGEEAGRAFGEMLGGNGSLLELSLRWNSLGRKGGAALAEGLRTNYLLNRIDIAWNGLGDEGSRVVSDVLAENSALTHVDISHNRIHTEGALALAAGIEANKSLLHLELGFNPLGMTPSKPELRDLTGIEAIVKVLKEKDSLSQVGFTEVQEGANVTRGFATRFDPANPAGHYILDISRAWDLFLCEALWARMLKNHGESWANLTVDSAKVNLFGPDGEVVWTLPTRGVLEFDYVDWKLGLEVSFRLDLSRGADHAIASKLLKRAGATEGEACTSTRLNDLPYGLSHPDALPTSGVLKLVYVCTRAVSELTLDFELDLTIPLERETCLDLWKRELAAPMERWKSVHFRAEESGDFAPLDHGQAWTFPEVPETGTVRISYAVRLSAKRLDRGIYFSPPIEPAKLARLVDTLSIESVSDFERWSLLKLAASANYFTASQAKELVDAMNYRKGKLDAAILLFSRTVDPGSYGAAIMDRLGTDSDRAALAEVMAPHARHGVGAR